MKQINCLDRRVLPHEISELLAHALSLREQLSEADIFAIQDKFLTNGFSHIKVGSIYAGRQIIETFLKVLPLYQDIGCLTLSLKPLKKDICNIYQMLEDGDYLEMQEPPIDDFFIEQFYCDFIWIEATYDLLEAAWFGKFIQEIFDYKIEQHIPILVISYDD